MIRDCTFVMNTAGSGAAVFCLGESQPRITGCQMQSNSSVGLGGAIAVADGAFAAIDNCEIWDNVGGDGGGICVSAARAVITDCRIRDNVADFGGGLSFISALDVHVGDTDLDGNRSLFFGGGVHASTSVFSMTGCRIAECHSDGEAGAIHLYESHGTIQGSQITGNYSLGEVGGVHLYLSSLDVTATEIHGNDVGISIVGAPLETVDARYNWWGDETGPYHPIENPGGLGDAVSDHVDFAPWNLVAAADDTERALASLRSFPNPFRAATTIRFSLGRRATVRLEVYDVSGRRLTTLIDGPREAGEQKTVWDASASCRRGIAGGVYFVRLWTDGAVQSHKVSWLR
jgi:hypothetical protein